MMYPGVKKIQSRFLSCSESLHVRPGQDHEIQSYGWESLLQLFVATPTYRNCDLQAHTEQHHFYITSLQKATPTNCLLQHASSMFSNASFICLQNMHSTFMNNYSLQGAIFKYFLVHVNLKVATPTEILVSITTLLAKNFYVHLIPGQKVILVSN